MTIEAGDRAPDFSLKGIDGETQALAEALDRGPVLLVFFKTTCGTCDLTFPYVNRLRESYPAERWSLWAIAQDSVAEASKYASALEMTYPVLPDLGGYPVSRAYDPPATPSVYLIDRGGQVVQQTAGFSKDELNSVSAALAQRLGAEPAVIATSGDGNPDFKPG